MYIQGFEWEKIGFVAKKDLGLNKCANCNQNSKLYSVLALVHVDKILAWQFSPKFGVFKAAWNFMITCPTCEKGYKFLKEKGRDEVQKIMLNSASLEANLWSHFINSHYIPDEEDTKKRDKHIKELRKEGKRILDDLSKLGMVALVEELISYKDKKGSVNYLKQRIEKSDNLNFDIELK